MPRYLLLPRPPDLIPAPQRQSSPRRGCGSLGQAAPPWAGHLPSAEPGAAAAPGALPRAPCSTGAARGRARAPRAPCGQSRRCERGRAAARGTRVAAARLLPPPSAASPEGNLRSLRPLWAATPQNGACASGDARPAPGTEPAPPGPRAALPAGRGAAPGAGSDGPANTEPFADCAGPPRLAEGKRRDARLSLGTDER